MSLTERQAEHLSLALQDELPTHVDTEITSIPMLRELSPEIIADLRADPDVNSTRSKMYRAWRRFSAIRLKSQGYTHSEIAARLGVSEATIGSDIRTVRQKYDEMARKDWAVQLEERIFSIDTQIAELYRLMEVVQDSDIDQKLRILDRIMSLEARRDKITGLDKAAASQHVEQTSMTVKLSFDQSEAGFMHNESAIEVQAIE